MIGKEHSEAPIDTQQSGFDGERRGSAAEAPTPQADAGGRNASPGVSREPLPEGHPTVSRETPDGPGEAQGKNKRSSFYVYLVVLFGAAFLMLLLAYFVQRRNNEAAISELRSTMDLSREELMEEIQELQEERDGLLASLQEADERQSSLTEQKNELERQLQNTQDSLDEAWKRNGIMTSFAILEQALRNKDYEIAAQQVRALCQPERDLDLGIVGENPRVYFDGKARLAEIIPLLEKHGALEPGEVPIPAPEMG